MAAAWTERLITFEFMTTLWVLNVLREITTTVRTECFFPSYCIPSQYNLDLSLF